MDNRSNLSIAHSTHISGIDCCNPYRGLYNSNTLLGMVDSGFDITYYPYSKTNQILFITKMGVLFRTLIFRVENRLLYEKGDEKHEKEKRNFWIDCRFFIDNIHGRTLACMADHQVLTKSLKSKSFGIMLRLILLFFAWKTYYFMENNLFKEVIIMKDFFKDYKELAVDTGRFYKKHWIGCIVLNTAISAVTAGYIFRDQIKDKLKEKTKK